MEELARDRSNRAAGLDLPVFCISAREAQKLEKRCKRDGRAACFRHMEHTEVGGRWGLGCNVSDV
jgi:hypothetical protein